MGVVSACLPSLRPLLKKLMRGTYKGPAFRSLTTGATKSLGAGDYASGSGSFSFPSRTNTSSTLGPHYQPHNHPHYSGGGRHLWDRNGGRGPSIGAAGMGEDTNGVHSFTRLEELNGPWGHNVHVQGGRQHHRSMDDKSDHFRGESESEERIIGLEDRDMEMKKGGEGARRDGDPERFPPPPPPPPSRGIRVKTEVTLISTQRLDYRDHLY